MDLAEFTKQKGGFVHKTFWQLTGAFFSGVVAYRECVQAKCVGVTASDEFDDLRIALKHT